MSSKRRKKWPLAVKVPALVAIALAVIAKVPGLRCASDIEENGAQLKLTYVVCTGPYNIHDADLMYTGTPARDNQRLRHVNSIVMDDVYAAVKKLEDSSGGSTVSYIPLNRAQLDHLAGLSDNELGSNVHSAYATRSATSITNAHRLSRYRDFFSLHPVDLAALDALGVLPKSASTIRRSNPDYNEVVDLSVDEDEVHEPGQLAGTAYLRSIRVTLVRIENVSNRNLSAVTFHVRRFPTAQPYKIRAVSDISPAERTEEIPFATDILQPGETITLPLSIEVVPTSYAQGEVYSHTSPPDQATFVLSRHVALATPNTRSTPGFEIRSKDKPTPFAFGPAISLDHVTWQVDAQKFRYGRSMARNNLIYGNGNCECGSCPIVSATNRSGDWRKMRELLTDAAFPQTRGFTLTLPGSAQQLMISENRGENAYLSSVVLSGTSNSGKRCPPLELVRKGTTRSVTHSEPFVIDLSALHAEVPDLASVQLQGVGYYRTQTSNICPHVLPLPWELFESTAGDRGQSAGLPRPVSAPSPFRGRSPHRSTLWWATWLE
jgi:hypothetical protein